MEELTLNNYNLNTAQIDLEFKDAILEMCNDLLTSFDLKQILSHLISHTIRIFKAKSAFITLIDKGKAKAEIVNPKKLLETESVKALRLAESSFSDGAGLIFAAYQSGEIIAVENYLNDSRFQHHEFIDRYFQNNEISAVLAVPIKMHEEVVAVLTIFKKESYFWNKRDQEHASQLAKMVALPIYNARLYENTIKLNEELAQRTYEFEVLQNFNRRMRQAPDNLKEVSERALALISEVVQIDLGFVHSTENTQWELLAALPDKNIATKFFAEVETNTNIIQRVFSSQKSLLVGDILELAAQDPTVSVENDIDWRSAIFVPLSNVSRGIGVVGLASTKPHFFNENQLHFVDLIVGQVAYIIQKVTDVQYQREQEHLQSVLTMAETASHQLSQPLTELQIELDLIRQYNTLNDLQALERMQDAISRITSHVRQYQKIIFTKAPSKDSEIVILD